MLILLRHFKKLADMLSKTRNNNDFLKTIVPEENGW